MMALKMGTSEIDKLVGTAGISDTFVGLKGNDKLRGNGGNGSGGDHDVVDYSRDAQNEGTRGIRVNLWGGGSQGGIAADTGYDGFGTVDSISGIQDVIGTKYNDIIYGGTHSNYLTGGAGNDRLSGFKGKDKLTGGTGADKLYGGTEADVFVFKTTKDSTVSSTGRDTIYDFSHTQADKIDLRAIDANTTAKASGNQVFKFIGTQSFHDKAGELRYVKTSSGATITGDITGDGKADFAIVLKGTGSLVSSDFLL